MDLKKLIEMYETWSKNGGDMSDLKTMKRIYSVGQQVFQQWQDKPFHPLNFEGLLLDLFGLRIELGHFKETRRQRNGIQSRSNSQQFS